MLPSQQENICLVRLCFSRRALRWFCWKQTNPKLSEKEESQPKLNSCPLMQEQCGCCVSVPDQYLTPSEAPGHPKCFARCINASWSCPLFFRPQTFVWAGCKWSPVKAVRSRNLNKTDLHLVFFYSSPLHHKYKIILCITGGPLPRGSEPPRDSLKSQTLY